MKRFIKNITQIGWGWIALLALSTYVMWIPQFLSDNWLEAVATAVLTLVNAVVLMFIAYKTGATHSHSAIPVLMYLLFIGVFAELHFDWQIQVVTIAFQTIIALQIRSYRNNNAVEESFLIGVILALTMLLEPDVIFFLPFVWFGFSWQRALNGKVILASIIGMALVALYLALLVWMQYVCIYSFVEICKHSWINTSMLPRLLYVIVWTVFFFVTTAFNFTRANSSVQSYIVLYVLLLPVVLFFSLLQPNKFSPTTSLLALSASALATYYFSSKQTMMSGISFVLFILLSVAISLMTYFGVL
ncbi:MAG: hypothetical protein IJ834_02905 [Paludibacteraceae bacterium]|nr:hypothetical protein [Paludibacteraceae bacterium]